MIVLEHIQNFDNDIKVVIDTNVLISAVISSEAPNQILKLVEAGKIKSITSLEIIKELDDVLSRDKFDFISEPEKERYTDKLLLISEITDPKTNINIVRDPEDNKFIECAIEEGADYIISGDQDLLEQEEYKGIKIVKPATFIKNIKN